MRSASFLVKGERCLGSLLHVSSLPGAYGIGDMGPAAHSFVRHLADAGIRYWQFLPLTPISTALGSSPYSSPSAFAGNELFISPERLLEEGFITHADLDAAEAACGGTSSHGPVNFDKVGRQRELLCKLSFERMSPSLAADQSFAAFTERNRYWLVDYARFVTIKKAHGGASWTFWPEALRRRDTAALANWDATRDRDILREQYIQYLFFRQWEALRDTARANGVGLIGDMPIYVTHDSADVWANPGLFRLDAEFQPLAVAGVPPDYFSATGQRWGNPVYDWDAMRAHGFSWWLSRVGHALGMMDVLRLDHFRGFAAYWEIPADEATAVNGRWVPAPGMELFAAIRQRHPRMPIIAEDLGVITSDVEELLDAFDLPGMKVLQFAFGGSPRENSNIPFQHRVNSVVYSGTHDNDTALGWFRTASQQEKAALAAYVGCEIHGDNVADILARQTMASVAQLAILPVQDVLGLGSEARLNTPGTASGNWAWRLPKEALRPETFERTREMARQFGRIPY